MGDTKDGADCTQRAGNREARRSPNRLFAWKMSHSMQRGIFNFEHGKKFRN